MELRPAEGGATERELAEVGGHYSAIADLGLMALAEHSRNGLFDRAVELVRDAFGVEFAKILELQPDGDLLVTAGVGWPPGVVGELELPADGDSQASYAMRIREPVIVEDLEREQRFDASQVFLELGVRSGVNVVIEGAERPYGILEVDSSQPRQYSPDAVSFLQLIANVLGSAVDREIRERQREQFVEAVAHEIRNPLTSVMGFSRRLTRTLKPGTTVSTDSYEELELLLEQVGRLGAAVDLVFQLARVERPHALARDPIILAALLEDMVDDVRRRHPDISFEEVYEDEDITIRAEESAARAALRNIIDNAAKYSTHPPRQVQVALTSKGEDIVVRVTDTCGGLTADELNRMFEQNYRGEDRGSAGLGVGLYLAMRVCSAFGWRLEVINHPGVGCQFEITIPGNAANVGSRT